MIVIPLVIPTSTCQVWNILIRPSIQLQVFNEIQGKVSQSVPRGFGQWLSSKWIHSWCSNFDPYPGNLIFVYNYVLYVPCIIYNIAHGTYIYIYVCVICTICIYMCVCVRAIVYVCLWYIYICVCVIAYINVYIYINRKRERERQGKQEQPW